MIRLLAAVTGLALILAGGAQAVDPEDLDYADRVHLQQALIAGGWLEGKADGAFGPKSRAALERFEEARGGPVDADLDAEERAQLLAGRTNPADFELLPNTDLYGFDYRSGLEIDDLAGIDLSQCQSFCTADSQCAAYTYNVPERVCFLKSAGAEPSAFPGAISGRRLSGAAIAVATAPSAPAPPATAPVDACDALPRNPRIEEAGRRFAERIEEVTRGFLAEPGQLADLIGEARQLLPEIEARAKRDLTRLIPEYESYRYEELTSCREVGVAVTKALLNIVLSAGTPEERRRVLDFAVLHSLNRDMFATDALGASIFAHDLMELRLVRPALFLQAAAYTTVAAMCEPDEPRTACGLSSFASVYEATDRGLIALDFLRQAFEINDAAAPGSNSARNAARALAVAEWKIGSVARAEELFNYGSSSGNEAPQIDDPMVLLELAKSEGGDESASAVIVDVIGKRLVEEDTIPPGVVQGFDSLDPSPLFWAYVFGQACEDCSPSLEGKATEWARRRAATGSADGFLTLRTLPEGLVGEQELLRAAKNYLGAASDDQTGPDMISVGLDQIASIRLMRREPMTDAQLATLIALAQVHPQRSSGYDDFTLDFARFMVETDLASKRRHYQGLLDNYFSHLEEFGVDDFYADELERVSRLTHAIGYRLAARVMDEHILAIFEEKIALIGNDPDVVAAIRAEEAEQVIPALVRLARAELSDGEVDKGGGHLRAAHDMALEALAVNWRTGDQRVVLKLQRLGQMLDDIAQVSAAAAATEPALTDLAFASAQLAMLGETAVTAQAAQRGRVLADPKAQAALDARDAASDQLQLFNYYRNALGIGDADWEKTELARRSTALARAERALEAYLPSDTLVRLDPLGIEETRALLREDEALLVLRSGETEVQGLLLAHEGAPKLWSAPIGAADLAKTVEAIRAAVQPAADGSLNPQFPFAEANGLYRALLGPVAAEIGESARLLLVVDGPLQLLPFSIMPTSLPEELPQNLDDFRGAGIGWLGAEKALVYLPVVSSLRDRAIATTAAARAFAGFGHPVLGRSDASFAEAESLANGALLNAMAPLPETQVEVYALAQLSGAGPEDVFVQSGATETRVKSAALDDYRVLLFATHGLLSGELDGMAEPGLVFSPPATPTSADDGYLGLGEVMGLDLNAELVILSACNTAAGDGSSNASGLSGLARGFLAAGAQSVAVTHWSIPSAATLSLNFNWFEARQRAPEIDWAEAHRRAIVAMVETEGPARFAHPANWGAFEIFGSPK